MNKRNLSQNIYEQQCFSIAYKLIEEVIAIREDSPYHIDLQVHPNIKILLGKLDTWIDGIVRHGGL